MALNDISFKGESLTHSFKGLVISSIYLLLHFPDGKKKIFLHQKSILLCIESIVLELIVLLFCDQVYILLSYSQHDFLMEDG